MPRSQHPKASATWLAKTMTGGGKAKTKAKTKTSPLVGAGIRKERKPHRFRPGTVALREIRRFQKSTDQVIPHAPFYRLVKEILGEYGDGDMRVKSEALFALQEAAEVYICELYSDANLLAIHSGRVTVMQKDLKLRHRILSPSLPQPTLPSGAAIKFTRPRVISAPLPTDPADEME